MLTVHPSMSHIHVMRENKILDALASLRHDVMEEIMKVRLVLDRSLGHSKLMTSHTMDSAHCDDVGFTLRTDTVSRAKKVDNVMSDVDNRGDDVMFNCAANLFQQSRRLPTKSSSFGNTAVAQTNPLLRSPDYNANSEVLYGSAALDQEEEDTLQTGFDEVEASSDVTKAHCVSHNHGGTGQDNSRQTVPGSTSSLHVQVISTKAMLERDSPPAREDDAAEVTTSDPRSITPSGGFILPNLVLGIPDQNQHGCPSFPFKHSLRKEEIPKKKSDWKCRLCQKSYSSHSSFSRHKRTHTKINCFQCNSCHKFFPSKSSYVMHERIHTGEKPFHCDVCNKSFSTHSNLKVHTRIHTGEKPHNCEVCGRAFSCTTNLKVHMRTHTGERPYKCKICPKHFSRLSYLRHHVKTTHFFGVPLAIDTS